MNRLSRPVLPALAIFLSVFVGSGFFPLHATESPRVFLAGSGRLHCALGLSDGTVLVGGEVETSDWIPGGAKELPVAAASGWKLPVSSGTRRGVILHLSEDLEKVLSAVTLPAGRGGPVVSLKTDSAPGSPTGAIYLAGLIEGNAETKEPGRYWLGRLDANFLKAPPARLEWGYNQLTGLAGKLPVDAIWDVGSDGKIVFYNYASRTWGIVCRLKADGSGLDSVPQWRNSHGATQPDGSEAKVLSLKSGNGDLRSTTWEDFLMVSPDGNGGLRRGRWPDDFFYPAPLGVEAGGRGYSGYGPKNTAASSVGIVVDRRSNDFYVGYNTQSVLPPWNDIPNAGDFEPAVLAFTKDGGLRWWSRLYTEISPGTGPFVSSDGGTTWTKVGKGFVFGPAAAAIVFKGSPLVVTPSGIHHPGPDGNWKSLPGTSGLRAITSVGKILLAGGSDSRLLVSSDQGATWTPISNALPSSKKPVTALAADPTMPSRVFAAVEDVGLFVSDNEGQTWSSLYPAKGKWRAIVATGGETPALYALSSDRLEKSTDGGASWVRLNIPGKNFTALAVDPSATGTLLVSSSKGGPGIRVSNDGGTTWKPEKVGNEKIETVIFPGGGSPALCGSSDRGLYLRVPEKSNDWSRVAEIQELPGLRRTVLALAADSSAPGRVFAFGGGAGNTSSPDQYIDALALDYSQPPQEQDLVVLARSHGNNVTNFWSGREGSSFMRRQTGTKGNEHYNWIGRLKATDGTFVNSTWFVGLDPTSSNFGPVYLDANLAGWPDHNAGNANLKGANGRGLRVGPQGDISLLGTSRAAITTANAYQQMTSPLEGIAPWHDFLRIHPPDLSTVIYATALTGESWDIAKGEGAGNTRIAAAEPLPGQRILAVGWHTGDGPNIPTANIPSWGRNSPTGESMILALLPIK
ncbi:MAG: hypothetical protein Fur0032_06120 [Terrimicrobiaceae bacterium]